MRKALLPAVIIITSVILIARIFYLQVIDETLKLKSENNAIKKVFDFPERGYIYDRNGKLLVANQPSYDIMVVPREIKDIDVLDVGHMSRKIIKINNEDVEIKYYYTEITKLDVNKWNAIKELIKILNIDSNQVATIGDNVNDKEMLENAGMGIVMENSADYVKKYGKNVCRDNNSDWVSDAIEKYVL